MEAFKEFCQVLESNREKNHRSGFTESLNFFIFDKVKLNKVTHNVGGGGRSHYYYCFCSGFGWLGFFFCTCTFTGTFFNILVPVQKHCQANFSLNK